MLRKCIKCGKQACWSYIPNDTVFCDDCVPRGCTCNIRKITGEEPNHTSSLIMWWDKDSTLSELMQNGSLQKGFNSFYYEILDEQGRRYPCCEYEYSEEGFEE